MKIAILFLIFLTSSHLHGAATILRISGTIENDIRGDKNLAGRDYELQISYDSKFSPISETNDSISYSIELPSLLILDGEIFPMQITILELNFPAGGLYSVNFSPQTLSGFELGFYGVGLGFQSQNVFWDDPRSLPESLDEWMLDEANFSLFYSFEQGLELVEATSSSYSRISILTVPEPSSVALTLLIIPFILKRIRM